MFRLVNVPAVKRSYHRTAVASLSGFRPQKDCIPAGPFDQQPLRNARVKEEGYDVACLVRARIRGPARCRRSHSEVLILRRKT